MKLTLPLPPSANRYWRTTIAYKNGKPYAKTYVSEEAKDFKMHAGWLTRAQMNGREMLTGNLGVSIDVYPRSQRQDTDNYIKPLLDALQGILYKNDSQICSISIVRRENSPAPRVEVEIRPVAHEKVIKIAGGEDKRVLRVRDWRKKGAKAA